VILRHRLRHVHRRVLAAALLLVLLFRGPTPLHQLEQALLHASLGLEKPIHLHLKLIAQRVSVPASRRVPLSLTHEVVVPGTIRLVAVAASRSVPGSMRDAHRLPVDARSNRASPHERIQSDAAQRSILRRSGVTLSRLARPRGLKSFVRVPRAKLARRRLARKVFLHERAHVLVLVVVVLVRPSRDDERHEHRAIDRDDRAPRQRAPDAREVTRKAEHQPTAHERVRRHRAVHRARQRPRARRDDRREHRERRREARDRLARVHARREVPTVRPRARRTRPRA